MSVTLPDLMSSGSPADDCWAISDWYRDRGDLTALTIGATLPNAPNRMRPSRNGHPSGWRNSPPSARMRSEPKNG